MFKVEILTRTPLRALLEIFWEMIFNSQDTVKNIFIDTNNNFLSNSWYLFFCLITTFLSKKAFRMSRIAYSTCCLKKSIDLIGFDSRVCFAFDLFIQLKPFTDDGWIILILF